MEARPAHHTESPPRTLRTLNTSWRLLEAGQLGFGSVAWLEVSPTARSLQVLRPDGSLAANDIQVRETGLVPVVEVENLAEVPVLLPAHAVLFGGRQSRLVTRTVVLAGGARARVPVRCVEVDRWAPRDEASGLCFQRNEVAALPLRWNTSADMAANLQSSGSYEPAQSNVWRTVGEDISTSPLAGTTRSYEVYLRRVREEWRERVRACGARPPPTANAVLLLPSSGGWWLEAYPTPEQLEERAEELLADLYDPRCEGPPGGAAADAARGVLDLLWEQPLLPLEPVIGTVGAPATFSGGSASVGTVVLFEGVLAHLAIGTPPPGTGRPGGGPLQAWRGAAARGRPETPEATEARRQVHLQHRGMLDALPAPPGGWVGFRLVAGPAGEARWCDVGVDGGGHAVIGTKPECDLCVPWSQVELRRLLLAACFQTSGGEPVLRLVGLHGSGSLHLGPTVWAGGARATHPFVALVGGTPLSGFPWGATGARLGEADPADPLDPLPGAMMFSDLPGITEPGGFRLTLTRGGESRELTVGSPALDAGVWIGRGATGSDARLHELVGGSTSRYHLLLLQEGTERFAYDLCSTNGTSVNGSRVRRVLLEDRGTTLQLGPELVLHWRR